MKNLLFTLAMIAGFITSDVHAQSIVIRRPLEKVVIVRKPRAVIACRPLAIKPSVIIVPPAVVVTPPVIARPATRLIYTTPVAKVAVRKTVIYKL